MKATLTMNQVVHSVFLVPAYGRSYNTREEVLQDWSAGKDFKIEDGPYCSKHDVQQLYQEFGRVHIMYSNGVVEV